MPKLDSAQKAAKVSLKKRMRNRATHSALKTYLTKTQAILKSSDISAAQTSVLEAVKALDKAASKGLIHPNKAARHKSRLMVKLNAVKATAEAPTKKRRAPRKKTTPKKPSPKESTKG
ncbi:MAG: 30S ribosomal protein S20 [Dehalococcoidia bacterium]